MALAQITAARRLAAATPANRNRYADFLRAVSILAVVVGHWLMTAVWFDGSGRHEGNVLALVPETQWLTWGLQVMPLFFVVGGFSNYIGWRRSAVSYGQWLRTRLRRLVLPTIPPIVLWIAIGLIGPAVGLDPQLTRIAAHTSLIPLWFLAVYVLQVASTPLTVKLWHRYGLRSVAIFAAAAVATDVMRLLTVEPVGYANHVFVWGAIYLLGHAWGAGVFASAGRAVLLGLGAGAALVAMTVIGPYHHSMVGVPGVEFGNTSPPTAALLALGLTQIGIALAAERPMRRILERPGPWTTTIAVNGSIMSIYVWHMTSMVLTIGLLLAVGSPVFDFVPGSASWWVTRPLWMAGLAVATLPFLAIFGRFERPRSEVPGRRSGLAAITVAAAISVSYTSLAAQGLSAARPAWALAAIVPVAPVTLWLMARRNRTELLAS